MGGVAGRGVGVVLARVGPPALVLAGLLAGWEAVVAVTAFPPVVLPSPAAVLSAAVADRALLLGAAAVSALTAVLGVVLGGLVGLGLALVMVVSRAARATVQPYLVALRIAPLVAVAPLVFLWAGSGIGARALLVATLTVFPVALGGLDGLRSTPQAYLDLARSVDASPTATFLHVRLPAAGPSVFAGAKLAAALSVVGTVVAEFLTLRAGLGYRVFAAADALETARAYAALFALAALGLSLYGLVAALERHLLTDVARR
jgi:ABC-type nitrate/sulfonate/bicarbonate transport system permease component